MNERLKTRDQSLLEYLDALQAEYIQAELRRKIYPKPKDKKYWDKVLLHKEVKIRDIAGRNDLPCIFTDERVKKQYRSSIIRDTGIPNFFYKNLEDRAEFEVKDFRYYFSCGSEVKVLVGNGRIAVGTISSNPQLGERVVIVKLKGDAEPTPASIEHVTRIL